MTLLRQHDFFPSFYGQGNVKNRLNFYLSNYQAGGIFPHCLLSAGRGSGKTTLCKLLGERLGKKRVTATASSIKNSTAFFGEIILPHVVNQKVTLFVDESSELPKDVQTTLLTILDPNPQHITTYLWNGTTYTFDFRNFTFLGATTNIEKILPPLVDRFGCHRFDFQIYSDSELLQILEKHCEVKYDYKVAIDLITVSRRNCRRIVDLSSDLLRLSQVNKVNQIDFELWQDFKRKMGIRLLGLNDIEVAYLKELQKKGVASLTVMAASLDLSPQTIRCEIENYLHKQHLIDICGKRQLSSRGWKLLRELEKIGEN